MCRAAAAQATRRPGLSRLRQGVCVEVVRQPAVRVVRGPAMNPTFSQRCARVCEMQDTIGSAGNAAWVDCHVDDAGALADCIPDCIGRCCGNSRSSDRCAQAAPSNAQLGRPRRQARHLISSELLESLVSPTINPRNARSLPRYRRLSFLLSCRWAGSSAPEHTLDKREVGWFKSSPAHQHTSCRQ